MCVCVCVCVCRQGSITRETNDAGPIPYTYTVQGQMPYVSLDQLLGRQLVHIRGEARQGGVGERER